MLEYLIVKCTSSFLRHVDSQQSEQISLDWHSDTSGTFTLEADNGQFGFELSPGDETRSGICVMSDDRRIDVNSFSAVCRTLTVRGNDDSFVRARTDILQEESMRLHSRAKAGPVAAGDERQQQQPPLPRQKPGRKRRVRVAQFPTSFSISVPPPPSHARGEPVTKKRRRPDKPDVPMPGNSDGRLVHEFETLNERYGHLGNERARLEHEFEQALLHEDVEALMRCHGSVLGFMAEVSGPTLRNYKRLVHVSSLLAQSAAAASSSTDLAATDAGRVAPDNGSPLLG